MDPTSPISPTSPASERREADARARPRITMTEVADGAVVLDEETGTFYHLNPTGALAYSLLRTGDHTVAEVARALSSAFGSDPAATLADVEAFADALARKHLVRPWG